MTKPLYEFRDFRGICNTTDPMRIPKGYLAVAENADIDDERMLHLRPGGEDSVYSGNTHSFWSNEAIALFVESTNLKRLWPDWSTTVVLSDLSAGFPMQYVDVDGVVYFTDNVIVGLIQDGTAYPFPEPDQTYKKRMVGGHLLEYFNSRLYAALDDKIYFSDAKALTRMDYVPRIKNNMIIGPNWIMLAGKASLLKAVKDGLYIGDEKHVYFYSGMDPFEFSRVRVTDSPAKPGSGITLEGEDIGKGQGFGTVACWTSSEGIWMGLPGGIVKEVTNGLYSPPEGIETGAAIGRFDVFGQYIYTWKYAQNYGLFQGAMKMPVPVIEGRF